jgi:hypothetical protein
MTTRQTPTAPPPELRLALVLKDEIRVYAGRRFLAAYEHPRGTTPAQIEAVRTDPDAEESV